MSIRSFYPRRVFDKNQSKTFLIGSAIYLSVFVTYFVIKAQDAWFFASLLILLGLYQLVGIFYAPKNGLYRKKGEKIVKSKSVPPEEFLAKAKKEAKHGKK